MRWGPPTTVRCYKTDIYVTVWILLCANKVWKKGGKLISQKTFTVGFIIGLISYILQSLQKDTGVRSWIAKLLKGIQCTRAPVDQQLAKKFRELFYILPDQTTTSGIPHARTLLMTRARVNVEPWITLASSSTSSIRQADIKHHNMESGSVTSFQIRWVNYIRIRSR